MDSEELESYKFQLGQVVDALQADPENAELVKLKSDLEDLINLSESFSHQPVPAAAATAAPAKPAKAPPKEPTARTAQVESPFSGVFEGTAAEVESKRKEQGNATPTVWAPNTECLARWAEDGQFYPAVITAVSSGQPPLYSVVFKGYNTMEFLKSDDLQPLPKSRGGGAKRNADAQGSSAAGQQKSKVKKTKKEESAETSKQKAWLAFATGNAAGKKGKAKTAAASINKKSIFATSDNPNAKGMLVTANTLVTFAHYMLTAYLFAF